MTPIEYTHKHVLVAADIDEYTYNNMRNHGYLDGFTFYRNSPESARWREGVRVYDFAGLTGIAALRLMSSLGWPATRAMFLAAEVTNVIRHGKSIPVYFGVSKEGGAMTYTPLSPECAFGMVLDARVLAEGVRQRLQAAGIAVPQD